MTPRIASLSITFVEARATEIRLGVAYWNLKNKNTTRGKALWRRYDKAMEAAYTAKGALDEAIEAMAVARAREAE
jgi:hypothetical protein